MGLNFKILVIWKALSTMSPKVAISAAGVTPGGFGSAGSKAASSAAPPAASSATLKATSSATSSAAQRGNRGSGKGGGASLTQDQVASQSTAVVASTPRARHGATSAGGKFVTREEFNEFRGQVRDGFSTVVQQNQRTHDVLAGFLQMMNGGLPASKAPVSRQIGNGSVQEVVEQHQMPYGQNAGWDPVAEGSGRSATSSSQFSQRVVACGGGAAVASESSRFVLHKEAPTAFRGSSGGSTLVTASHLQNFEQNFAKMKQNDFNNNLGIAIRNFVANFYQTQQDEMACVLLGMVNGKKYPAHNHIIIQSNESVFRRFFGELATKFASNAVMTTKKAGQQCSFPFKTLSTNPNAMHSLICVLRGEE